MSAQRLVFAWIGDADLIAWATAVGGADAQAVMDLLDHPKRKVVGGGPIKTLLDQVSFDEVHLLSDKGLPLAKRFAAWLGSNVQVHGVRLPSPVDYAGIFEAADQILGRVTGELQTGYSLSIHLSPGTPAMTAVWVLLGKSKYPASFYQTFRGEVIPTEIPFDLLVDFVPSVLRGSDRLIQTNLPEASTVGFDGVIGTSASVRYAKKRAARIALRDVGVLLLGESGVGKEVFARAIHAASRRGSGPFVAINCAAVPKELLESLLFGHKKGAYTGAIADHAGAFEEADHGTLFLDEVGECDLQMQAKLLRVLQPGPEEAPTTRTFRRLNDTRDRRADVRILAATNRDLIADIAQGRFREDLYYRLAAFTLKIPPLRSRATDVPAIADHLLSRINGEFAKVEPGYEHKRLSVSTKRFLSQQPWPGNVRQLQNALLQAAVMVEGAQIEPRDVEPGLTEHGPYAKSDGIDFPLGEGFSLVSHLEDVQRRYLARAMQEAKGKKTLAAKLLGYPNYQTLAAQLERLNVKWSDE